jgi:hypothetical protein
MRDLTTSLISPQIGTWTQNDLQLALSNSKLLEILGNKWDICLLYLFKISALLMMTTKSYHFQNKWLQNWGWNFRYLDLSQYSTKWHEMSLTHIFLYDLYDLKASDPKKLKKRRYDQKTRSNIESSKAHNSHKTYLFLLKIWE